MRAVGKGTPFTNTTLYGSISSVAAAKSLQSCPTLCDPKDNSPPGSPVPRILQARTTGVGCHFLPHYFLYRVIFRVIEANKKA